MSPPNRSLRRYRDTTRLVFGVTLLLANFYVFFSCSIFNLIPPKVFETTGSPDSMSDSIPWEPTREQADLRISKATIFYESSERTYNARILALHDFHNEYLNYKTRALRTPIVRGALNKFLYLQSLIITELQKPVEHQTEWILYFNSAVILANPHIPLHHFPPPVTDVETFKSLSIIAAESASDHLNTSVFFIRVSGGSLRILTEAMETIYNAPYTEGYENEDNDGGLPSAVLQDVLYREHHEIKRFSSRENGLTGPPLCSSNHIILRRLIVSSPSRRPWQSTMNKARCSQMQTVHRFWHTVSEARRVLEEAKEKGHTSGQGAWWEMVKEVKEWVELRAWDTDELERRVAVLRVGLNDD